MDRTPGSALPGKPIPPSFTFSSSSPYHRPYTGTTSSSFPHESSSSVRPCDYDFERQRHLRQNQEIIRLCTLRSVQIRQSEAKLSELEDENLELRTALRHANRQLDANIDRLPPLPPREHVHETHPAEDGSRTYPNYHPLKRGRVNGSDDCAGIANDRNEQGYGQEQEYGDQYWHNKRLRTRSSEFPLISKQQLLSKLDQIQAIYRVTQIRICMSTRRLH